MRTYVLGLAICSSLYATPSTALTEKQLGATWLSIQSKRQVCLRKNGTFDYTCICKQSKELHQKLGDLRDHFRANPPASTGKKAVSEEVTFLTRKLKSKCGVKRRMMGN